MKNASFSTIIEDWKISFKFAAKNVISFLLGIFGVLIVSGVLIVVVNKGIYHAVNCEGTFRFMINDVFGRISAEDCLLSGDSTRCRMNAVLFNNRSNSGVFVHQCENEEDRQHITEILKGSISI